MTKHEPRWPRVAVAAVTALLPAHRSGWGAAMRAELAGIDEPAGRRVFAMGCLRAVLTMPTVLAEAIARALLLVVAVVAIRRFSTASSAVWAEAAAVLTLLTGISWRAARRGAFGPVATGLPARLTRAVGYLLLLLVLAWFLSRAAGGAPHDPSGWWVAGSAVTLCWIAWSRLTADGLRTRTLGAVVILSVAAWAVWELTTLAIGAPNMPSSLPTLIVVSTSFMAFLLRRRLGAGQTARVASAAPVGAAVLIFATAAVTDLVHPDPRHEVMDPLAGMLVFTALLTALVLTAALAATGLRLGRVPGPTGPDASDPTLADTAAPHQV